MLLGSGSVTRSSGVTRIKTGNRIRTTVAGRKKCPKHGPTMKFDMNENEWYCSEDGCRYTKPPAEEDMSGSKLKPRVVRQSMKFVVVRSKKTGEERIYLHLEDSNTMIDLTDSLTNFGLAEVTTKGRTQIRAELDSDLPWSLYIVDG